MCPGVDHLIVALVVGNETHVIVLGNLLHLGITLLHQVFLRLRDDDVVEVERQTGLVGHTVAEVLDTVEELASLGETYVLDDIGNDVAQRFLRDNLVDVAYLLGDDAIHDDTTDRGLDHTLAGLAVNNIVDDHLYLGVQVTLALVVGNDSLLRTVEGQALALGSRTNLGDIVESEHHIL